VHLVEQTILELDDIHFIESSPLDGNRLETGFNSQALAILTSFTNAILALDHGEKDGRAADNFLRL
jgi:hypothetical protein